MAVTTLENKVLAQLAEKPVDGDGYNAIAIEGHTVQEVDLCVKSLHLRGLINAVKIPPTFGGASQWHAASLTQQGRNALLAEQNR